jgi:DNA invertase Pin-like site-specific DNA recombinase
MPTAIAYIRVSTEEQANEGVSLAAQEAKIRAYCTLRGLDLVEVVVDAGVSAWTPLADRAGGSRVQDMVRKRKADAVVALKLDRIFRNCSDCLAVTARWDKSGVALHLTDLGGQAVDTRSAMGRFFLTVMAGAAELERNQVGERTAMAMQHKAAQGEFTGGDAPYGFRVGEDGTHLEAVAHEQAVVEWARALRASGLSLRGVAAKLAERGLTTRTGKGFLPAQVSRMLAA